MFAFFEIYLLFFQRIFYTEHQFETTRKSLNCGIFKSAKALAVFIFIKIFDQFLCYINICFIVKMHNV